MNFSLICNILVSLGSGCKLGPKLGFAFVFVARAQNVFMFLSKIKSANCNAMRHFLWPFHSL